MPQTRCPFDSVTATETPAQYIYTPSECTTKPWNMSRRLPSSIPPIQRRQFESESCGDPLVLSLIGERPWFHPLALQDFAKRARVDAV